MSTDIAIRVEHLSKAYKLYDNPVDRLKESIHPFRKKYHRDFYALNDINFEVKRGECVAVIGRNGSGKSTLLKILTGVLTPTSGSITVTGTVSSLLELGAGFNFEMTGIENVYFNGTVRGISNQEMNAKIDAILAFAEVGDFVHQPVKTYSSGMFVRLAFASAISTEPDILIVDEALAVGDAEFQTRCFARMNKLKSSGTTIVFVSHDIATVRSFCDRALYLNSGEVIGFGDVIETADLYQRDILKRSHASVRERADKGTVQALTNANGYFSQSNDQKVLDILQQEEARFHERAKKDRRGSGRISFLSFALINQEGMQIDLVDPTQAIKAYFLLQSHQAIRSDVHIGLIVKDKCGSPVAVIRDSNFELTQQFDVNDRAVGEMKFSLPLMAGVYYMEIGVLLFSPGKKYENDTFNFIDAEVSDLVEYGAHFTVASWRKHPIPANVLVESDLTLTRYEVPVR